VVCLSGKAAINSVTISTGQAVIVPEGSATVSSVEGTTVVRCWEPGK
jgi:hypothetical protein